ncbi:MAG: LysR family transcriptional regulator [Eubacteriales bacterium]|nr:LysR family transcriptional regulator [Eubacteriales bacterium]
MNTKQIEYILELSQTLNFNQAAENLFIAQPTLTYQIKNVEEEIGFPIFNRSGKGASLTPAGFQFCLTLRTIQTMLRDAIEQGQNFNKKYREDISIGLPLRSAIHKLPDAIMEFSKLYPDISITPKFHTDATMDKFTTGELDIIFALEENVRRVPEIKIHKLFDSGFYLITQKKDPLAAKEYIVPEDLIDRTLMIGGGSPPKLRALQDKIVHMYHVDHFNSQNHDTTLTNVASGKGVCIAPGFLDDHNGEFAWIPFRHDESFSCVLCTHAADKRKTISDFIQILQKLYV